MDLVNQNAYVLATSVMGMKTINNNETQQIPTWEFIDRNDNIQVYNLIVKGAAGGLEENFLGSSFLSLLTMKRMPRISRITPMMIRMIPIRKYRSTLSLIQYEVGIANVAEALSSFNTHFRSLTPL